MRALAEFWADGPQSETPPGHWNVLANDVSDELEAADALRIGGTGPVLDRLEWDVKIYLALNGAVHDAAIAAWGLKGKYDSGRPISLIRYMGGLGQSSDPTRPVVRPRGLPLVPGLIEVVTAGVVRRRASATTRLARSRRARSRSARWAGQPDDPETQAGGVGWILATEWMPYQLPTFVTPAFAGLRLGPQHVQPRGGRGHDRLHRQRVLPRRARPVTLERGVARSSSRARRADVTARVGDLLRRGRPGRPVAPLRRHPHPGRRLHRPDHRLGVRRGGLAARVVVLTPAPFPTRRSVAARTPGRNPPVQ